MSGFTYAEVGATRGAVLPVGYGHVERSVVLARGQGAFERAAQALMTWEMHRAAGLRVPESEPAAPGVTVRMRLLGLPIPCRVVYTVRDERTVGFAYGTLPGHPERGEEAFLLEKSGEDVVFRIRAFSVPASLLARAGGPLTRLAQSYATTRYVEALRGLAVRRG